MDFNKLSSPSLKELFIKEIEKMILSGQLSVGDKLPSERELSERMGVSRVVINSGLSELSRIGFIERKPRIGAFVADFHRKGTVETLMAILRYNGGVLKKADVKSLLEIRMVMETLAIELVTPILKENDFEKLNQLVDNFEQAPSPEKQAKSIFNFHQELCALSGNTMLPVIFYSFKELSTALWERYFQLYGKELLVENTKQLVNFLKEKDKKKAITVFQSSLKDAINGAFSIYQ